MNLCLTKAELINLTDYKHRRKQMKVLTDMDIPFRVTPAGEIKVIRSNVDSTAGRTPEQPDYGAI